LKPGGQFTRTTKKSDLKDERDFKFAFWQGGTLVKVASHALAVKFGNKMINSIKLGLLIVKLNLKNSK
jgi:hypothetical protein